MKVSGNVMLGWATAASSLVLCLGQLAGAASAADKDLNRRLPLKDGGRLTIENTQGDIRISSWDEQVVELRAEISTDSDEEMSLVPVEIDAKDDEIRITSLYPVYAPKLKVKVNYRLRVPRETDLKLIKTMNGDLRISGVSGRAIVEVANGEIEIEKFSGYLKATATNGKIEAEVSSINEAGHVALENYNGDISLRLPRNTQAYWLVKTMNGHIDSTIPFTIKDEFGPEVARLDGAEEPVIHIYSINGDIRIEER
jgi:DUF4097 and DUF4098 domain-containing protein YvlB